MATYDFSIKSVLGYLEQNGREKKKNMLREGQAGSTALRAKYGSFFYLPLGKGAKKKF